MSVPGANTTVVYAPGVRSVEQLRSIKNPVARLKAVNDTMREAEQYRATLVAERADAIEAARADGVPWAELAAAVGVSTVERVRQMVAQGRR